MRNDSKANKISELVNSTLFNPLEVGVELSTDHRYLVNEMFKTSLHFIAQLSRNFENGNYDGRNEYACKMSKAIIDALEKDGLYDRKHWENYYDEIISKSY